jgi:hypothetical protein
MSGFDVPVALLWQPRSLPYPPVKSGSRARTGRHRHDLLADVAFNAAMTGPKSAHGRRTLLSTAAVATLLFWIGEAQAQSCADLYIAIKTEARSCDFFCDQARLKPLQQAYSASCIHVVLPLSPFDLDSIPQDAALVVDIGGFDAEARLSASTR